MARRRKGRPVHGWVLVDKPSGLTSTQVVGRVRRVYDAQKVGHGGTLDPIATGLLPIALGEATKTVAYVMEGGKSYSFTLRWGQATDTDDIEGEVVAESPRRPEPAEIEAALPAFRGEIEQTPPAFSAIKVAGRRAYDLARSKEPVTLEPRLVTVTRFELVAVDGPDDATFVVDCGKGTYMRALARDLGRRLGTHAHLVKLRRTAVGGFTEEHAISLESLESLGHSAAAFGHLHPVETGLDGIPALALTEMEASRLRCGQAVSMLARSDLERVGHLHQGETVCAMSAGKPVALARFEAGDLRPLRVLNL
ncbi:MAG: tRNA pseudouridine(55) synthase TruB [Kiloniellales bacterium]|nr:tRNA pseudouridine(55) synthase TruB [Kiloniellales bacterium]